MPSWNSFSIRKLFSSPGRLSLIADEAVPPTDDRSLHSNSSNNNGKRRSDTSTSSALLSSGDSQGSTPSSRGSTVSGGYHHRSRHGSRGSSGSSGSSSTTTIFHPDSSISITTPQAERGLTDNVDHELSQEEIDRIKAVVAAAAAAAASSLRLRMDEGSEAATKTVQTVRTIQATTFDRILTSHRTNASTSTANIVSNKKRSESTESAIIGRFPQPAQHTVNTLLPQIANNDTNTNTDIDADAEAPPPIPRRKNRRIPQPIVVPPRNAARLADTQPARRSNSISIDRGRIEPERNKDKSDGTDKSDKSDKNSRTEKVDKGDKSERSDRVDKKRKSQQQQQQHRRLSSQGRRGRLGAKSGNGKNCSREQAGAEQRKSGRSEKSDRSDKGTKEAGMEEKQKQHEAGTTPPLTVSGQVQVQSHPELQVQLAAAGNSKGKQAEGDKRHNRQTGETAQQTAPKNKQLSQGRQDQQNKSKDEKDKDKDKQGYAAADERRAAWQHDHDQHDDAPSSSTVLSTLSSSSPSASPSSSALPPSSSSSLSKTPPVLPPLPLYTTIPQASIVKPSSRASLPARAPPNLLSKALPPPPPPRVSSYFATRPSCKSKTEKSKTEKQKTEKSKAADTDTHIHPLYRGQNGESDSKKDSGIALDRSQSSLDDTEKEDSTKKVVTTNIAIDSDSDSDADSCIDLLQALAIQPEEADLLRRPTADSSTSTSSTNMMQSSSLLTVDSDSTANANAADGPSLRDVCTTPTFTQPRMAPTPSPSAVPSETNTPRRVMSPTPSPQPSFMGPTSRTSGTFNATSVTTSPPSPPSPKKQGTRFLPLRLNKGLPDAALRIQRKRSKKARKRERQAALNTKGQPFSDGKSQMDVNSNGASSNGSNKNNNNSNNNSNNSGSSRWTLPDNVTELFNGRLFSRMEVTETLPFEKLQAIRESRALAQKQQEEAEEKKKAKQLLEEQDEKEKREAQNQKQQQELVDAEQALIKELQRPQPHPQSQTSKSDGDNTSTTAPPLETLLECEEEELQVSPLGPEDAIVDADGNPIESSIVSMPVSPPTDAYPPPTLPMPPHIATQMVWPSDEEHDEEEEITPRATKPDSSDDNNTTTKTKTLFLSVTHDEPDGSTTPIEPFHMEDLPSRIGAAGVRVSILLPVEEEEAYFASSVAQHKERRRREQEEREREEEENQEVNKESEEDIMPDPPKSPLDEIGPFPSPPSKNPMRFQSFIKKMALNSKTDTPPPLVESPPTQPIPQVTVTDVDSSQKCRRRPNAQAKASSRKSLGKTPKSSFFLSSSSSFHPSSLIPHPRSSLSASSSTSSMAAVAAAASATPHQRDEETYVYLSATPFSLVMPTYRHGPIRLNRCDLLDNQVADSRNSYDHKLRHHHHHPNIATVEETLDWTAFQMAILGGAGEFRSEVIDYGQISAAEQDEADRLADWFWSLDIKPERLLSSADEDKEWVRPVQLPPDTAAVPPTLTHHTQRTAGSQWTSVSSSTVVGVGAPIPSGARGLTHSRTTTDTSIATMVSGYSSSGGSSSNNRDSSAPNNASNIASLGLTAQEANQTLPFPMSRNNSNSVNSSYAMSRDNSTAPGLVSTTSATTGVSSTSAVDDDITPTQPRTLHSLPLRSMNSLPSVQDVRASFASVASYESMPQSPMADLIMTRGADGKEYVAPMGYNLSHDLGDYLQWEKDNVYAMALEEPR